MTGQKLPERGSEISVKSAVSTETYRPMVVQTYRDNVITFSAEAARNRAIAILQAIAYADTEAVVFETISNSLGAENEGSEEQTAGGSMSLAVLFVRVIREKRQELPPGIRVMFGVGSSAPLVVLEWQEIEVQLGLDMALLYADELLKASAMAQSSSYLYQFVSENFNLGREQIAEMVKEFRLKRYRHKLESALD